MIGALREKTWVSALVALLLWQSRFCFRREDRWLRCTFCAKRSPFPVRKHCRGAQGESDVEGDWRDFRAYLVARERGEEWRPGKYAGSSAEDHAFFGDWAYNTSLLERGSLVLSQPGGFFLFRQPYFHKVAILIIDHSPSADIGVILNRPTGMTTADFGVWGTPWPIWYGGDCGGLTSRDATWADMATCCIHTLVEWAVASQEVVRGVYVMSFHGARDLVDRGHAKVSDFMLMVGLCGWGRNQLQEELDRGYPWTLASVSRRILVKDLRYRRAPPRHVRAQQFELDDGTDQWKRLYRELGDDFCQQTEGWRPDDFFGDLRLKHWLDERLVKRK
eukprot:TRINITY_DN17614_c0_g2_i1.p1 TRINITY_DN17614_c0_g2~~TRINITY_DN17614_c0_g2_i1.p1  ORF type:complete len:333 (+),score=40.30 TRINITY_DN17614_c0_g2_i1:81-1079(+)